MHDTFVLAVDIGGTKLETAVVDGAGSIVAGTRSRRSTGRTRERAETVAALRDSVAASLAASPAPVTAAGIGSAGPVDLAAGSISPHNLPLLWGLPVRDIVAEAAAVPTVLRLDGTCIAVAESWLGATRGSEVSLSMVVSTGVGGGIIADGRPLAGASGNAGHIGQIHVHVDEPTEAVEDSTLEAVASGPAAVRWARRLGWDGVSGEELARGVLDGDPIADQATRRSARLVGQAIASVTTLLDLDAVAIGGGFSRVRADYIDIVREAARDAALFPYARRVRINSSGLGDEGPLLGAASLALRIDEAAFVTVPS
ncbi:ROK family protein [Microbacterium plantarum]|uniref:ROK family protein n=1 Tax=Microbacterium plantarum TaxID=1816425 RepID=UPI002B4611F0|nr:ROK family protein [Microbacterium plantarum]WRK17120.1 ROK family protein [Microbacterium plantarum]